MLLIAPMSGHFATLLRGTLRTLLRDHQVYVTDWLNPREVALEAGVFGLEDYTQHLIDFVRFIGEETHIVAVCQPTVSALIATAVLAAEGGNVQPASLTLMAGPIDTRVAPTKVNELAQEKPIEWFRDNLIGVVPAQFAGHDRRVYPGFLQLSAFMSMNAERHAKSFVDLFQHRIAGDFEKADAISAFYREYFAIMDMSADFYLETVDQVFQRCLLPLGQMISQGPADRAEGDPQDFPADRRGREGRHLRRRPDAGRAGPVFRPQALHEDAPFAAGRRPLRGVQRATLGDAGLPGAAQSHPLESVGRPSFIPWRSRGRAGAGDSELLWSDAASLSCFRIFGKNGLRFGAGAASFRDRLGPRKRRIAPLQITKIVTQRSDFSLRAARVRHHSDVQAIEIAMSNG